MYCPKHFEPENLEAMHELIRAFPLATLVMQTNKGLVINHVPMHLSVGSEPGVLLSCHMPRSNPAWEDYAEGSTAIAVFHGPQAYVTPSWYPSKQRHGKVVPTWNYATVHAHGRAKIVHDCQWLASHLEQLTTQLESQFDQPWSVSDAPAAFKEKLVNQLVGIEIPVDRLEGKWKVSQNRPAEDRVGVIEGLKACRDGEGAQMAALVSRVTPGVE